MNVLVIIPTYNERENLPGLVRAVLAHDGYRVGRMRNRAIAATECDFIVIVDGDMLLHPEFVADHRRAARPGHYLQGCRILLDERATRHALATGGMPRWTGRGLGLRRVRPAGSASGRVRRAGWAGGRTG